MISLFKPKKIKDFNPKGLKIYTFNAGFKKKDKDLLLIIFDKIISYQFVVNNELKFKIIF